MNIDLSQVREVLITVTNQYSTVVCSHVVPYYQFGKENNYLVCIAPDNKEIYIGVSVTVNSNSVAIGSTFIKGWSLGKVNVYAR